MSAQTPRMSALQQLAGALPVANSKVAAGQKAARDMQLQSAVAAVPAPAATVKTAQTTGAAAAEQAGSQQVQNVMQQGQQLAQLAQTGQQVQGQTFQNNLQDARRGAQNQAFQGEQKLAAISSDAKKEMFDSRKQFAQDQLGAKFANERQLADYARLRAGTEQEWQSFVQKADQAQKRSSQLLDTSYQKIAQQLAFENDAINQIRDQANNKSLTVQQQAANQEILRQKLAQREELMRAELAVKQSIAKKQAKAGNNTQMWVAGGTIVGAVAGGFFGGPAGAMAGGSGGGAAGAMIGAKMNEEGKN